MKVVFTTAQGLRTEVAAAPGERLLDVGQRGGMPLEGTCEGQMACSTCHVIVDPAWFDRLAPACADEEDMLPEQNTIETVTRQDGLGFEVGIQNAVEISDAFQVTLDYKIGEKSSDQYSGDQKSRYDLLSKESDSKWQKSSIEFAYSSVKSYFKNSSSVPFIASLNFFDTLAGKNIERRFGQEASFTLFF